MTAACLLCGAATDGSLQCAHCRECQVRERDDEDVIGHDGLARWSHRQFERAIERNAEVRDALVKAALAAPDIVLPLPPSANAMYRAVGGKILLSRAARKWKREAEAAIVGQVVSYVDGPVEVEIAAYFTRRRRDLDNVAKATIDAIKSRLFGDDALVQRITLTKHIDTANPRVVVRVRAYQQEAA